MSRIPALLAIAGAMLAGTIGAIAAALTSSPLAAGIVLFVAGATAGAILAVQPR